MPHPQAHPALCCELDGIAQQVDQDLAHSFFITTHHSRQAALGLVLKGQSLGLGLQLKHGRHLRHQAVKVHWPQLQGQLATFDLGNIERALDQ